MSIAQKYACQLFSAAELLKGHIAHFIDTESSDVAAHLIGWLPGPLPKLAALPVDRLSQETDSCSR